MIKVVCDHCHLDLTETSSGQNRILLMNEKIPYGNGPTMDVYIHPILQREYNFCSLRCLKEWLS